MSYVQRVLQPGEQVRRISSIHWIGYWPGVAVALLAVVAFWFSETRYLSGFWRYTTYALALVAVVLLIQQWFQWWVTEIAVTNRRSHLQERSHPAADQRDERGQGRERQDRSINHRAHARLWQREYPWHWRRLRDAPHHSQPNRASKQHHHRNDAQSLSWLDVDLHCKWGRHCRPRGRYLGQCSRSWYAEQQLDSLQISGAT